jgi:AraC-like DNA-binding protein
MPGYGARPLRGLIAGANRLLDREDARADAVDGAVARGENNAGSAQSAETMKDPALDEITVSVHLTRGLITHAAKQGMDPEALCRANGLDPALLDDPEARIPARAFRSIWGAVARHSRDEDFGLHLGAGADLFQGGGILYTVMRNCPTLGDAIDRFCRYHGLIADFVMPRLQRQENRATIALEPIVPGVALDRHHAEAVLAGIATLLAGLVDGGVPLLEVQFSHPMPNATAELHSFFGCRLRFRRPANALVFAREQLSRPVALADPALLTTLEQFVQARLARLREGGTWGGKVRSWLGRTLARGGKTTITAVARELGVSGRQLQSRLKEEGTSYQKLLDQVREELALDYLKQGEGTLCELAFLLGYSEQSAFNHAFKRWTGSTPGEFVQKRRSGS